MTELSIVVQVVVAVLLVVALFAVGFFIYNTEKLRAIQSIQSNKQSVPIFRGVLDLGLMAVGSPQVYDTVNPFSPNYVKLVPAYNQLPGAGFTYNFWLYVDYSKAPPKFNSVVNPDGSQTTKQPDMGLDPTDYILLLRGDPVPKKYKNICNRDKNDILIKCPLIKLENGWDSLTVEFNTVGSADPVHEYARNQCGIANSRDWLAVNNHKISVYGIKSGVNANKFDKRWFMVTVILKDTSPGDPIPLRNKARCIVYINGQRELDRYVDGSIQKKMGHPSVLKQNTGHLYVGPKVTIRPATGNTPAIITSTPLNSSQITQDTTNKVMMADLTYYNYELEPSAISKIFRSGFSKDTAPSSVDPKKMDQTYLDSISAAYNKPQLKYL